MKNLLITLLVLGGAISCGHHQTANPPAPGFNAEDSDPIAIEIADRVMEAMGGRQAWDQTKVLNWTFFDRRHHSWNKRNHTISIEIPSQKLKFNLDLNTLGGQVIKDGEPMTNADSLEHYSRRAYEMWINDSYWLVMPYKLKDSGVTLQYVGEAVSNDEHPCHILELTFDNVGVTPQNKYNVYVDTLDYLVRQWDFYSVASDSLPRFQSLWPHYDQYGEILLSGGVLNGMGITNISVE